VKVRQVVPAALEKVLAGVERAEPGNVGSFAVSPDGRLLLLDWQRHVSRPGATGAVQYEGQLELWDLTLAKRLKVLEQSDPPGSSIRWDVLRFSPDGTHAVGARGLGGDLEIWDVHQGKKLHEVEIVTELGPHHARRHSMKSACFRGDGKLLFAISDEGRADVIDVAKGVIVATWKLPTSGLAAVALHPEGKTVAFGGEDHSIHLLDAASGREMVRWEAHDTALTDLAFSPDGRTLVSGSADGTVKLWDLPLLRRELAALGLSWD
jgi:WD40 repeat protein